MDKLASDELKHHGDVELCTLTAENRNELTKTLIEKLKSIEEIKQ